jgi:hypothetical protein
VELKAQVTKQIVNLFKGETDLRRCWKILDELGMVRNDFDEAAFQKPEDIIEAVVDAFVVQEDAELSQEGFLNAQSMELNQKYKDVRKALSIKAMRETLDFSTSPAYYKGAHSYACHPFSACISLQGTHALVSQMCQLQTIVSILQTIVSNLQTIESELQTIVYLIFRRLCEMLLCAVAQVISSLSPSSSIICKAMSMTHSWQKVGQQLTLHTSSWTCTNTERRCWTTSPGMTPHPFCLSTQSNS